MANLRVRLMKNVRVNGKWVLERNQSWCDLMKSVPSLRSLVVPSTRGLRFRIQSLWFRSSPRAQRKERQTEVGLCQASRRQGKGRAG
jgi:hypothetical protein